MKGLNKQQILASLDKVQKQYCKGCFLHKQLKIEKGRRYAHRFCITQCTVGEEIKKYGQQLVK
ncbi:zinc-finger domain-containing protein [Pseudoneobacillus sp. C159]